MGSGPYMIGIAGVTCSGKSFLAKHLKAMLPARQPVVLQLDSYYRDLSAVHSSERENRNFDSPDALDHETLRSHVRALSQGRAISRPVYDFSTHTRAERSVHVSPDDLVIVEGLFALYWKDVRRLFHTKVFVNLSTEISLSRRLERDVRERGRTRQSVLTQYHQTVKPMNEQSVIPTRDFADLVVSGADPVEHSAAVIMKHLSLSSWNSRVGQ